MKPLFIILIGILLLLGLSVSTQADGWQFDFKMHTVADLLDMSQRLTKDLGSVNLTLGARQFKLDGEQSNHLNLSLRADWWGVEYLTGENITNEMRAFSLFTPGSAKAKAFQTPCSEVLHTYIHKEFGDSFVQFDWFKKGMLDEMKVHARAEF